MKYSHKLMITAVACLFGLLQIHAEDRSGQPGKEEAIGQKKGQKYFRQMLHQGEGRRGDQPMPFLMAGDPRFEQMLKLALVDEDKIGDAIRGWQRWEKMEPPQQRRFMQRLNQFREKLRNEAAEEASKLGLRIPEEKRVEFFRNYWTSRMQLEQQVRQKAEAEHERQMVAFRESLKLQWSGE